MWSCVLSMITTLLKDTLVNEGDRWGMCKNDGGTGVVGGSVS